MDLIKLLAVIILTIQTTLIVIWLRKRKLRDSAPPENQGTNTSKGTEDPSWLNRFDITRLQTAPQAGDWITQAPSPSSEIYDELFHQTQNTEFDRSTFNQILDCHTEPGRLVDLIARDPNLQTRILETANSSLYDLAKPITFPLEAIARLGPLEIQNILIHSCIAPQVDSMTSGRSKTTDKHWRHGLAVSRVVYGLAQKHQIARPQALAVAALLHDVGKLYCLQHCPEPEKEHLDRMPFSRYEYLVRERQWIGIDHGWLSGEMVRQWGLSSEWADVVARHHVPSYQQPSGNDGTEQALAALHLADLLVHLWETESEVPGYHCAPGWIELVTGETDFSSLLSDSVQFALAAPDSWRTGAADQELATACQHQPVRWVA
jgi:putative nucleotidyltransferase with HDIG domain